MRDAALPAAPHDPTDLLSVPAVHMGGEHSKGGRSEQYGFPSPGAPSGRRPRRGLLKAVADSRGRRVAGQAGAWRTAELSTDHASLNPVDDVPTP